jgi:hypothetical protein
MPTPIGENRANKLGMRYLTGGSDRPCILSAGRAEAKQLHAPKPDCAGPREKK